MRFEEKLNLGITAEEIEYADSPKDIQPNHRAILDAIHKLLDMDMDSLYDFATSGGYIEEGTLVINKFPSELLIEQVISRTVHTGNYTRILEITIDKAEPQYKVYIIVNLKVSDERVNASIQKNMANWKAGDPLPFVYYETENQALKAMGDVEDAAASKDPGPAKPAVRPIPKTSPSPAADLKQIAARLAARMGKKNSAAVLGKMSPREILNMAKQGQMGSSVDKWAIGKYIFLGWLGLSALATGLAGLAALIIGYFAIKFIEKNRQK